MAVWGVYTAAGNMSGEWMVVLLKEKFQFTWQSILLSAAGLNALLSVGSYALLKEPLKSEPLLDSEEGSVSFCKAWLIKGVLGASLTLAGVKMITYALSLWLPFYLETNFDMTTTIIGSLAFSFDMGGLVGTIAAGALADWVKMRVVVVFGMVFCGLPLLFWFQQTETEALLFVIITCLGIMFAGSYNMIAVVIAQDLAEQTTAKATVLGIVNGTGSLGAAVGQVMVIYR